MRPAPHIQADMSAKRVYAAGSLSLLPKPAIFKVTDFCGIDIAIAEELAIARWTKTVMDLVTEPYTAEKIFKLVELQ